MNYKISMFLLTQIRRLSTAKLLRARKNHYDSLGLTKNATQADVKGAYYELSKVYHPDKNQGLTMAQQETHSQKFRDITEAYEVLGNAKIRRMYDKGFMGDSRETTHKKDPLHKFYKSRETRHRPPPPDGRTPIYDFDEWSKRHYGDVFRRNQEMKERHAYHAKMKVYEKEQAQLDIFIFGPILFICICMFLIRQADNLDYGWLFGAERPFKTPKIYDPDVKEDNENDKKY